jgi:hypothetical protein
MSESSSLWGKRANPAKRGIKCLKKRKSILPPRLQDTKGYRLQMQADKKKKLTTKSSVRHQRKEEARESREVRSKSRPEAGGWN